jgi:RimJ/RimL family protein N-acetyltransferase
MELLPYADEHRSLTEALELDPEVMKELGGPADPADLDRVHRMRVDTVARGEWYFVIVLEPSGPPVGAIGIWESTIAGSKVHEVGWMVLPEFQGRGIASEALRLLIDRARSDPGYMRIHAFPGTTNAPSNALCRKNDFTLTEELEVKFRDRPLRVSHWELNVARDAADPR